MGMLLKLDAVASLDWEWESYPLLQDFMVLPFFVLLFPSVHFLLDRFVFEKVARRLIFGKEHATLDLTSSTKRKIINKFKESAWKCIYYPSSELLALVLTYNEPWFTDTTYFWVGPRDQVWPDQKMKLKLKAYYMYATGFYIYAIFALIFWETRRSDFVISMGHHVTTVILLTCSYMFRFARVGSIALALHEGSDVFIEVGKMSKYSGFERIADISFFMFVLSWFILRLVCYPMWIIRSTSYEILLILDKVQHGMDVTTYYYLFNTLLLCLLVFHIYWWRLMFLMLVKQIQERGHVSDDVRSDSEDENDHED